MKSRLLTLMVCSVLVSSFIGCAQKPSSANSSEAIKQAKTLESVEKQAQFLVSEANAFINSKQFEDAIKSAKYVLSNLDKNSTEAQSIIEKAKAELQKLAEQKMGDVKNKLGNLGK